MVLERLKQGDSPVQATVYYNAFVKNDHIFVFLVNQKVILIEYSKTTY